MAGIMKPKRIVKRSSPLKGKVGIVVAEWNEEITLALLSGAKDFLLRSGIPAARIIEQPVPGSFELPLAAQRLAMKKDIAGVICIGCLVKGHTPHFDYISQAVSHGIMDVSLKFNKPVIFGVLTVNTMQQALERAGGKLGNKGEEAAATLMRMM